jgi:hypothetical protein
MKLAHKQKHAVDMGTGAVVTVTILGCGRLDRLAGDLLTSIWPADAPPLLGPASRTAVWCQARCLGRCAQRAQPKGHFVQGLA